VCVCVCFPYCKYDLLFNLILERATNYVANVYAYTMTAPITDNTPRRCLFEDNEPIPQHEIINILISTGPLIDMETVYFQGSWTRIGGSIETHESGRFYQIYQQHAICASYLSRVEL